MAQNVQKERAVSQKDLILVAKTSTHIQVPAITISDTSGGLKIKGGSLQFHNPQEAEVLQYCFAHIVVLNSCQYQQ
jgi:hypothetical protein